MRYGIGVWNFCETGVNAPDLVAGLCDMGFNAVSFLPRQIAELSGNEATDLVAVIMERGLHVTVHGDCSVTDADVGRVGEVLGERLQVFSVDPLMRTDSCGRFFDASRMCDVLLMVRKELGVEDVRLAIEDFPLDSSAVAYYRRHFTKLLECRAFGVLIDLGHLNMRRTREEYFAVPEVEYFSKLPLPVVEVHVHDNDGMRDSHAHLGDGTLNVDRTAAALASVGFDGISTIEVAPSLHGSTAAASKSRLGETLHRWSEALETALAKGPHPS